MQKVNLFSLNFDEADFGNHVHDFVAMLLNNNNIECFGHAVKGQCYFHVPY